ncbi:MAG: tetratricopeptide repeat protein [Blastocatellia bacterium]
MAEQARGAGALRTLAYCYSYIGATEYLQGKFSDARANLERSAALYREINAPSGEAMALQRLGVVRTAVGEWEQALADLYRALEIARGYILQGHSLMRVYATLTRNRLEAADFHAALGYAEQGLAIEEEHGRCLICGVLLYPAAAMAYAKNGDVEAGRHFAQLACRSATEYGSRFFFGLASQATAMVEATDGNWPEAFAALDRAEEAFAAIPQPYEVARTRLFRAYVRLQRHKPQDISVAAKELSRAAPIFVKLGARASATQARSMLRQLRA